MELTLENGPDEGDTATLNYVAGPRCDRSSRKATRSSSATRRKRAPEFRYYFADFQRETPLMLLGIFFVAAVLLLARFGGFRALVGAGGQPRGDRALS